MCLRLRVFLHLWLLPRARQCHLACSSDPCVSFHWWVRSASSSNLGPVVFSMSPSQAVGCASIRDHVNINILLGVNSCWSTDTIGVANTDEMYPFVYQLGNFYKDKPPSLFAFWSLWGIFWLFIFHPFRYLTSFTEMVVLKVQTSEFLQRCSFKF